MATIRRTGKNLAFPDRPELVYVEHDGYAVRLYADDFDKLNFDDAQWNAYVDAVRGNIERARNRMPGAISYDD